MQFIKNGPDVPAELLEAHEEGRVVFFCGAGISYPAGLPMFRGLVTKIYETLGEHHSDIERAAQKSHQYDMVLGLLERRIAGKRRVVREALARSLEPRYEKRGALETHRALLTLGRTRTGATRLVTTNFDRVFEKVLEEDGLGVDRFSAPLLPVPKNRWDGLVYLHGLLPEGSSEVDLNKLVVSSGDFGLAYLTERWASRFVSELFRGYTICFVGYSINDPILRYMMDALAADKLMGEATKPAFAFGSYTKGKEDQVANEWEAKNVVPVLYKETSKHMYLHRTLRTWASSYRDGVTGKQTIVGRYANLKPTGTTKQDDFVGRLVWALSDKTGLPAKRFADMEPVPSLEWLEPFENLSFGERDLIRFGIQPKQPADSEIKFSLLNRPTPHGLAEWMKPVAYPGNRNGFDEVMKHLAKWLAKHVGDPELFLWAVEQGGDLHPAFSWEISKNLGDLSPGSSMSIVWNLLIAGLVKRPHTRTTLILLEEKLKETGFTPALRQELKRALTPVVTFSRPYKWTEEGGSDELGNKEDAKLSDLVRWEIELCADYPQQAVERLKKQENWRSVLRNSLTDFTNFLRDAMELMELLSGANRKEDLSYLHQPSIAPHEQNKDFHDWTVLIDLLRDSWLEVAKVDKEGAVNEVRRWSKIPYPVFRRFAFFAVAERPQDFQMSEVLDWLLSDDTYWLWTTHSQRESLQLIPKITPLLDKEQTERLSNALVSGPPATLFRADISPERLQTAMDRMRWLHLAKCRAVRGGLSDQAMSLLRQLEDTYPNWKLADDDRDEFPVWSSSGEEHRVVRTVPKDPRKLQNWLKEFPDVDDFWESDDWQRVCEKDAEVAVGALSHLSTQGEWPVGRWRQALQVWGNSKDLSRAVWDSISGRLLDMPEPEFREISHSVAWWLKNTAKEIESYFDRLFQIIYKILKAHENDAPEGDDDVVFHAINHPVGIAVEATMSWWFAQGLEDDQGVGNRVRLVLDRVSNPNLSGLHHGRVVLASSIITLFRVDKVWTSEHLLQYFRWGLYPLLASGMWASFLYSPRLYWPLLEAVKADFLAVPDHWENMEDSIRNQFLSFITFAAMEPNGTFTTSDFRKVFSRLSTDSLAEVADTMFRAQQGAVEQSQNYFENRILPFFRSYWPKDAKNKTPKSSEAFANLCAVSGDALPKALKLLSDWLQPISDTSLMVHLLVVSNAPSEHPSSVLELLSRTIDVQAPWPPHELRTLLNQIREGDPALQQEDKYQTLNIYLEQKGY